MRTFRCLLPAAILLSSAAVGCGYNQGGMLAPPGPIGYQQQRATLHDPYADVDAGPQSAGLRPRDFDRPMPEATRSQYFRNNWWGRW